MTESLSTKQVSDTHTMNDFLQQLLTANALRAIDVQFALFIQKYSIQKDSLQKSSLQSPLSNDHDSLGLTKEEKDALIMLSAMVSHALSHGHIGLPLSTLPTLIQSLGLPRRWSLKIQSYLGQVDFNAIFAKSQVVSVDPKGEDIGTAFSVKPLVYDKGNVYLQRYWLYEVQLAHGLQHLSQSEPLQKTNELSAFLDHLFKPELVYLANALQQLKETNKETAPARQDTICQFFDIVRPDELDWPSIDRQLMNVNAFDDLEALFSLIPQKTCLNWQKVAASVALTRRFSVISGGPGTGKTTTVVKLLAALIKQAELEHKVPPSIKLVAPTGKAAARLTESIGNAIGGLPLPTEFKALIPTDASTLHRLLGSINQSNEFRHHAQNPLHLDVLVIDEASMVDLPMMYKVMSALPPQARVILLGDKDQLSSVEAGSVLSDICELYDGAYSHQQQQWLSQLTGFEHLPASTKVQGMSDGVCVLQKSYRFDSRSGIGQLARAVNAGDSYQVAQVWGKGFSDIEQCALSEESYQTLLKTLSHEYAGFLKELNNNEQAPVDSLTSFDYSNPADPLTIVAPLKSSTLESRAKRALDAFNRCRLLCAVREGEFGIVGMNRHIERMLSRQGHIKTSGEMWYHGRPIMVTQNDHALGIYNGDVGICILDMNEEVPRFKVCFELPDGSIKSILPSRVPEHETAFAMTIHKSQGSEFDYTLLLLPPESTPFLTKELIYTGITRAKKRLSLYANTDVVTGGLKNTISRASGLAQRLI
ncbi:exodeoxyribonuclease V subunit alpha [Vibrio sp.]|nr:exodeoxyribonuclease V subunit alpha [Vibrio sp.]